MTTEEIQARKMAPLTMLIEDTLYTQIPAYSELKCPDCGIVGSGFRVYTNESQSEVYCPICTEIWDAGDCYPEEEEVL